MSEQANLPAAIDAGVTIETFSFGDDVSVIDGRSAWGYFEGLWRNGDWYEPPVPFRALAKSFRMAPHHESAIRLKVNMLRRHFVPSRWMDARTHERLVLDYLQMGNFFAEAVPNLGGRLLRYAHSPALHTRVGVEAGRYFWVQPDPTGISIGASGMHEFKRGSICHVQEPDVEQEIYGLPGWLSALNSGLLNESATLFRRRYFINGGHAGFVFLVTDSTMSDKDATAIKERLKQAKGRNNFKNIFLHLPNGKKESVQILPISEVAAKDEFQGIKNVSRDDILAAHRTPPQLLGIVPQNNGGFGDIRTANDVFFANEATPIMAKMMEINDHAGLPVVAYRDYEPMMPPGAASPAK
jgi:PBSX family phage portal protein